MNGDALVKKTTKIMFGDAGISGTAQYMSQLVWVLFLKVFDYKEEEWELEGNYSPVIPAPFRFRDWADPRKDDGTKDYSSRITGDKLIDFVNNTLFPYLRGIEVEYEGEKRLFASEDSKAAIIRSFMAESQNYMKDGVRLRQLINEIGDVDFDVASEKHDFNDFYERLLKELQNGGKATGEFYTPRAITSFIVDHVDPKIGENVADFACGTGGFLADSISHLQKQAKSVEDIHKIQESVYGIEWKQLPYMLCVTNMYLHNIDDPHIVHGDGLAKDVLDLSDSDLFNCIVMNPPFGGEFNKADLKNFPDDISSSESADLFVARIIYCLKKDGRCGLVLPDGLLFNSDQSKVNLKRLLMTECNLHTVIRLPGSVFAPYTSISTNLLFFDKTGKTEEVWFYRMDMPEGRKHFNKTHPITREDMRVIDEWWDDRHEIKDEKDDPSMTETWKSKKYTFKQIEETGFNLDLCGFPEEEEIILSPEETIANFKEKRARLEAKLDEKLSGLTHILYDATNNPVDVSGFSAIERQLVELHSSFADSMRKSILQYAMQGKLVEQRPEEGSAKSLLTDLTTSDTFKGQRVKSKTITKITEDDELFDIPETWEWVKLGSICTIARGGSPRPIKEYLTDKSDGVNWIKIGDADKEGKYIYSTAEKIKPSGVARSRMVHAGDFLLTNSMSFGRPYILMVDGCIHDGWLVISQNREVFDQDFLYWMLSSSYAYAQFCGKVSGSVVKNLNSDKVANSIFPLPPLAEQKRIVEKLEQILPRIDDHVEVN